MWNIHEKRAASEQSASLSKRPYKSTTLCSMRDIRVPAWPTGMVLAGLDTSGDAPNYAVFNLSALSKKGGPGSVRRLAQQLHEAAAENEATLYKLLLRHLLRALGAYTSAGSLYAMAENWPPWAVYRGRRGPPAKAF